MPDEPILLSKGPRADPDDGPGPDPWPDFTARAWLAKHHVQSPQPCLLCGELCEPARLLCATCRA